MKKIWVGIVFVLLSSTSLLAQEDPVEAIIDSIKVVAKKQAVRDSSWKRKTEFGANLNQGTFSSNWTGGGVNSIALGLFFNAVAEYKKGDNAWRNDLQTQYGVVKNRGQESRKNVDRIFFDTKYSRRFSPQWSFTGNLNLLTQFAPGYLYERTPDGREIQRKVSGFFAPAYVTEALGLEYKPVPYFFVNFSPGAVRQTIVVDKQLYVNTPEQKNYGVPIGRTVRNEVALMQIVANFDRDIAKNVNLKCRYLLYASYDNLRAMDNRLDATLTAKVNRYMNVNLNAILIYDEDQSMDIQYAQSLAIGFIYKF